MNNSTLSQIATATPSRNKFSVPFYMASAMLTLAYVSTDLAAIELPVVAFKPAYIAIAGGDNEARFLCQLEYWTEKLREQRGLSWDGWVWNTVEEWEYQTGLTPAQQKKVKKNLEDLGLIEYKRSGRSGVLHYRLNVVALWTLVNSLKQIGEKRQTDRCKKPKTSSKIAKPYTENTPQISSEKKTTVLNVISSTSEEPVSSETQELANALIAKGFDPPKDALSFATEVPEICRDILSQLSRSRTHKPNLGGWLRAAILKQRNLRGVTPEGFAPSEADLANQQEEKDAQKKKPRRRRDASNPEPCDHTKPVENGTGLEAKPETEAKTPVPETTPARPETEGMHPLDAAFEALPDTEREQVEQEVSDYMEGLMPNLRRESSAIMKRHAIMAARAGSNHEQ